MNLIICVDNKNGIMFNGRRQSRDRAVCEDILDMTGEHLLYTSEYSFALFEKYADSRVICSGSPAYRQAGEITALPRIWMCQRRQAKRIHLLYTAGTKPILPTDTLIWIQSCSDSFQKLNLKVALTKK